MKPIDVVKKKEYCKNLGAEQSTIGIAVFGCNKQGYQTCTEACTKEDWEQCPLNPRNK